MRAYGAGFVVAGSLTGDAVVDGLARTAATEPAIRDVWEISTTLLQEAAVATIGYGLVMIAGAWLAGRSAWAIAVRRNPGHGGRPARVARARVRGTAPLTAAEFPSAQSPR